EQLIKELDALPKHFAPERLRISNQAHIILPTHKEIDLRSEEQKGAGKIGTTGRGIGPAYRDKMGRIGIRMGDAGNESVLRAKLEQHLAEHDDKLKGTEHTVDSLVADLRKSYARLQPHITNTP